ncbi:hypothetical protein HRW23_13180 [Streptomyces lunaelactis]|uniref:hypothetical protein n=1 Tax=Streptomyces lunaelactis TaxID=1535768 RepID=UPI001585ABF7|nr:hypothetical protein [Streptomyces lunaelactis]NUK03089.1 hypothetical protein [Streptomyces lunaelactis]NUK10015.1 hypothetical protein [Streptomyces lunaelactis]NUK20560.1 hypothetical protein [Streptomyces lunaelactis]NUK23946.1 hypothetical protein [Streptomyces lunaelactis]NUK36206.1 hypothetical protein [Streptomyces lunaelactis]
MKHGKFSVGAVLLGALATGTLAMAPVATAVEPTTATLSFDCGSFGSGEASLTATQDGTAATITVSTSAITAPIPISANSVKSTLTLTKNGTDTATFTGNSNPAIPAGSAVSTGLLNGTVAAGDSLEAKSLTVVVFGITATCNATSAQTPGPFVF